MKLTVTDIDGDNMRRTAIQQNFGESASARPDISAKQATRINCRKGVKATDQLQRTAADPGNVGGGD